MNLQNIFLSIVILCGISFKICAVGELENIGLGVASGFAFKYLAQKTEPLSIAGLGLTQGVLSGLITCNATGWKEIKNLPAVGRDNFSRALFTNGALMAATTLATAAATYGIEKYIKLKREARLEHARQKSAKK